MTTIRKLAHYEDELHDVASRKARFNEFGDPTYRQGLRALLDAFDTDLQLTETGWQAAYSRILRTLTARLYAQRGWAEHPEVLAIPIHRPIVITGCPRTGSTALHKLLSVDPQFQGLAFWLSDTPMIRPPRETWETHPAYRACITNLEALYTRIPELQKAHDIVAAEVEECTEVLMQSFVSNIWSVARLPTYGRWFLSQSARGSYRHYVDVLRLVGARDPHKRWLLKSPHHMAEIDTLLDVFPDACIIQTHRDPLEAIPSLCSLLHMQARDYEGAAAQSDAIGPRQCTYWRKALDRMQAARRKTPPIQFFDVDHRRFLADPLAIVHAIFEHFGLALSPHAEQQMRAWIAVNPTSRHGKHQYTVDLWGCTAAQIRDTFEDYRAQHHFN